jgi:hypothetical protein
VVLRICTIIQTDRGQNEEHFAVLHVQIGARVPFLGPIKVGLRSEIHLKFSARGEKQS